MSREKNFNALLMMCFQFFQCCEFEDAMEHALEQLERHGTLIGVQFEVSDEERNAFIAALPTESADEEGEAAYFRCFLNSHCRIISCSEEGDSDPERAEEYLDIFARLFAAEMEHCNQIRRLERDVYMDRMLEICNRNAFEDRRRQLSAKELREGIGLILMDVNDLKRVNDTHGHSAGDKLLRMVADLTKRHFEQENIYRMGGDEFAVVVVHMNQAEFYEKCRRFRIDLENERDLHMAIGYSWRQSAAEIDRARKEADVKMYQEKKEYHDAREYHDMKEKDGGEIG